MDPPLDFLHAAQAHPLVGAVGLCLAVSRRPPRAFAHAAKPIQVGVACYAFSGGLGADPDGPAHPVPPLLWHKADPRACFLAEQPLGNPRGGAGVVLGVVREPVPEANIAAAKLLRDGDEVRVARAGADWVQRVRRADVLAVLVVVLLPLDGGPGPAVRHINVRFRYGGKGALGNAEGKGDREGNHGKEQG